VTKKIQSAYARSGVDIENADLFVTAISRLVKQTHNSNVVKSIGGYASLYKITKDLFLAATTDGVGTKLKLAFDLNQHHTVGIDLVAMSVNDLLCVGAKPLFFLDYYATSSLDQRTAQSVLKGIVEGCKQAEMALVGGETAEMPGFYKKGEYDLAGFAVGLIQKNDILDDTQIKPGDVIIGLKSSGPHSNGFSLIRKLIREKYLLKKCLIPTKIYVREAKKLKPFLKGLAHITGSGFLNVPRMNENVDYDIQFPKNWKISNIFLELKKRGNLSWEELFTTFNMGIGMVCVVSKKHVAQLPKNIGIVILGSIKKASQKDRALVCISGPSFQVTLDYVK